MRLDVPGGPPIRKIVRIENPRGSHYTSLRSAKDYVCRGLAEWADTDGTVIRFLPEADAQLAARERRAREDKARYWFGVAQRVSGNDPTATDVAFYWQGSHEANEGQFPNWLPKYMRGRKAWGARVVVARANG